MQEQFSASVEGSWNEHWETAPGPRGAANLAGNLNLKTKYAVRNGN
jgi:hypothetical protein